MLSQRNAMKTTLFSVFFILLTFQITDPSKAQDNVLKYGDFVKGELTDSEFEVEYTFSGKSGDIIVIRMFRDGSTGGLESPEIILLNDKNKIVADTSKQFSVFDSALVLKLSLTGDYKIIATRANGRSGDSVGRYKLGLLQPVVLEANKVISDKMTNEDKQYYIIETGKQFTVNYAKTAGKYYPSLSVNMLDEGDLTSVGELSGKKVQGGQLIIQPERQNIFVVRLETALFDFYFEPVTATYDISFIQ